MHLNSRIHPTSTWERLQSRPPNPLSCCFGSLFSQSKSGSYVLCVAVEPEFTLIHWLGCLQIGKIMYSSRWDECAGPTAVFFVDMLKWLRLQPLPALLMTPFLASCTLCSLKLWEDEMSINLMFFFHVHTRAPLILSRSERDAQLSIAWCMVFFFFF